jgi:hypothetical protein
MNPQDGAYLLQLTMTIFFGDSDGDPIKGGVAWFGAVNQLNPIYFDHFKVEWY